MFRHVFRWQHVSLILCVPHASNSWNSWQRNIHTHSKLITDVFHICFPCRCWHSDSRNKLRMFAYLLFVFQPLLGAVLLHSLCCNTLSISKVTHGIDKIWSFDRILFATSSVPANQGARWSEFNTSHKTWSILIRTVDTWLLAKTGTIILQVYPCLEVSIRCLLHCYCLFNHLHNIEYSMG